MLMVSHASGLSARKPFIIAHHLLQGYIAKGLGIVLRQARRHDLTVATAT